jgi:hypothetical protein
MTDREFLMALNDKCVDLIKDADFCGKEEADSGNDVDARMWDAVWAVLVLIQHEISVHFEEEETSHAS